MPNFLPFVRAVASFCRSAGGLIPAVIWMYQQLVRLVSRLMNLADDSARDPSGDDGGSSTPTLKVPTPVGVDPEVLAALKAEFADIEAARGRWDEYYNGINNDSLNPELTIKESKKPRNRILNRYKNVSPYDHSRVVLDFNIDYVNANLVELTSVGRRYILGQGPLENTCSHFWLMIWQQKSKGIIMLNALFEKKIPKCHQYWPDKIGDTVKYSDVRITVKLEEETLGKFYVIRKFSVLKTGGSGSDVSLASPSALSPGRIVTQFHYTTWPDFGAPKSPDEFLEFLVLVRESGVLEPEVGPAVVHCSAGIGRSGTFCLVDACLIALAAGWRDVSIRETLLTMRHYRMGLVQTPDQYKFAFRAILCGVEDPRLVPQPVRETTEDSVKQEENGGLEIPKENGELVSVISGEVKLVEEVNGPVEETPPTGDLVLDIGEEEKTDLKRPASEEEPEPSAKLPKTVVE